jgi:hypothetical protein
MAPKWLLLALPVLCPWCAGCPEERATPLTYNVLRLSGAPEEAVFDAATRVLAEHFSIARADRTAGLVEGVPEETVGSSRGGRLGDVVVGPRRERRVAEVRVEKAGGLVKVYCKVQVQEYDTQAHQMFDREHARDDLPGSTPADRDAATTTEQNAVWRNRQRDRDMESEILRAIREQLPGAQMV